MTGPANGNCPANYTSEYIIASFTFNAPLGANLSSANEASSPNLTAWSIHDALGYASFSSTDANAAAELVTLTFSTNSGGAIVGWSIQISNFVQGEQGGTGFFSVSPTIICGGTGLPCADNIVSINGNSSNLGNSTLGQFLQTTASSITYQVSQTGIGFDRGAVTGIIQTDGTTGPLTPNNILGWNLVVFDGVNNTYELTGGAGGNSTLAITGTGLTATANQLLYDFGAAGNVQISKGSVAWALGLVTGFEEILPLGTNGNAKPQQGVQIIGTAPAPPLFTANAFFNGEQPTSVLGWYFLQFPDGNPLGYYTFLQGSASSLSAIFYHADLGYEYVSPGAASGSAYLYDFTSGHWWYSTSSLFPYLYDFTLTAWLYYFPNTQSPGRYTTNPRYFANIATNAIVTM